jgi:hypothetical protein
LSAFFDFMLSPGGLAAYAAFWAFKLTLGGWLLRRALARLPESAQARLEALRPRLPGRMRRRA